MNESECMVKFRGVRRVYGQASDPVRALDGVDLEIGPREFVAITGPSGCGKSTLLHLMAGMDRPDEGEVVVDGVRLDRATESELTEFRRHRLGVVFQFFHLLPGMTALENVVLPLLLRGDARGASETKAAEMLRLTGLRQREGHFPHQLSGGEMQRVAIARAMVHEPALLVADEPTGNLDSVTARGVVELFREISFRLPTTMILVTHSEEVASVAGRRIRMIDGKVESE